MRRGILKLTPVAAAFGALFIGGTMARANIELFTTQDDFSGWGSNGASNEVLAPAATPDSDGSAINGVGNTSTPGGTGTPGSLQVTQLSGTYNYFYGPGEQGNAAFLNDLGGSGTLNIDFQYPTNNGGSYFQLGVVLNYSGNFGQFFGGSAVSDGNGWYTQSVPYTINTAASYSYFQLGLIFNSNYDSTAPAVFNVDNIQVVSVPEPATLGTLGAGLVLLTLRRRRTASAV
jgi:PEP-CTERM motif